MELTTLSRRLQHVKSSSSVLSTHVYRIHSDPNKYGLENYKGASRIDKTKKFDKWIVVTSVSYPTEQVKYLSQIPGWRLVVVGDRKTPLNWSLPGCDYLGLDTQRQLGFTLTDHLPFGSYARKNIGYLYAVLHGAKFIYETDDDNSPQDNLKGFVLTSKTSGLLFVGNNVCNPYHHFGQSTLWPRGYPLTQIGKKQNRRYKIGSNLDTPTIQQGLVNGDPDMDAIFRLSRKPESSILNITFDPLAPPVILPEGVFSPFNSQNTLFHHAAFWALFIPTTTTFRVCDIWRGYWTQRLMWEVGGRLAFFPANAFQKRNSHSYLQDADQEQDMYFHTEELLQFLMNWFCEKGFSFFQCVIKLTLDMAERHFWKHDDVILVKRWIQDLQSLGYPEPKRINFGMISSNIGASKLPERSGELRFNAQNFRETFSNVHYLSAEQQPPSLIPDSADISRLLVNAKKMLSMCEDLKNISLSMAYFGEMKNASFFSDILLVIVFKHPNYSQVTYLDAIHSLLFPYVVYCGDNRTKFQQETGDLGRTLTFIEADLEKGKFGYLCAVKAMEMGYKVKGYLISGDDVMFKPWGLLALNKSHAGLTQVNLMDLSQINGFKSFWYHKTGRAAYVKSVESLKNSDFPSSVKNFSEFISTTLTHTKSRARVPFGLGEFYYIPASIKPSAVWYFNQFYKNSLLGNIAVPVVMCGLETAREMYQFSGTSVRGEDRNKIESYFRDYQLFLHPAKLTMQSVVAEYCRSYFPELLEKFFDIKY